MDGAQEVNGTTTGHNEKARFQTERLRVSVRPIKSKKNKTPEPNTTPPSPSYTITTTPTSLSSPLSSFDIDPTSLANLHRAAEYIRQDLPVAFPTETVYGLAANALSEKAVRSVFEAKGRPSDNPLIVHVSSLEMLARILPPTSEPSIPTTSPSSVSPTSDLLSRIPAIYHEPIRRFWPGPLTILLPKSTLIPDVVTGGSAITTVAVRFPAHPVARVLIEACGVPLAAPSANRSGRPSPTLASHVWSDLEGRIPAILDDGAEDPNTTNTADGESISLGCDCGVESTVLDALRSPPCILRPGGVSFEQLSSIPGFENLRVYRRDFVDKGLEAAPTTPGMKYRHYTPEAEVVLFEVEEGAKETTSESMARAIEEEVKSLQHRGVPGPIGIMRTSLPVSSPATFSAPAPTSTTRPSLAPIEFFLGDSQHPNQVARNLFKGLRDLEAKGCKWILVEGISEEREGMAVMNRLRKAASKIKKVGGNSAR
ncbi:hypothetical protein HK102_013725 [Quaeritorhiza haematococci]|nr:hypothetical protein HK102_013725 [Quaeritorhiza haematococci]